MQWFIGWPLKKPMETNKWQQCHQRTFRSRDRLTRRSRSRSLSEKRLRKRQILFSYKPGKQNSVCPANDALVEASQTC